MLFDYINIAYEEMSYIRGKVIFKEITHGKESNKKKKY